jgi:hypothetical protein
MSPLIRKPAPALLVQHLRIAQAESAANQQQEKNAAYGIEAGKAFPLVARVGIRFAVA